MVMRFGAIHEGTLPTNHSQNACINGSRSDFPQLLYRCSSNLFNWCRDRGGVGNSTSLLKMHVVLETCSQCEGSSEWMSPHRFLNDLCPLMELRLQAKIQGNLDRRQKKKPHLFINNWRKMYVKSLCSNKETGNVLLHNWADFSLIIYYAYIYIQMVA